MDVGHAAAGEQRPWARLRDTSGDSPVTRSAISRAQAPTPPARRPGTGRSLGGGIDGGGVRVEDDVHHVPPGVVALPQGVADREATWPSPARLSVEPRRDDLGLCRNPPVVRRCELLVRVRRWRRTGRGRRRQRSMSRRRRSRRGWRGCRRGHGVEPVVRARSWTARGPRRQDVQTAIIDTPEVVHSEPATDR
jgi:hypothetical protein